MILGVQTYTIRELQKENLKTAMDQLKDLGIHALELSRVEMTKENASVIKDSKMKILSVQLTYKKLDRMFDQVVEFCQITSCPIVVVSVLPLSAILGGKKQMLIFSRRLNLLYLRYQKKGIKLAFHHHDFEFKKIKNETKLSILLENTHPEIKIVTDTYWTKKSSIEPEDLIKDLGPRLIGVHLRDCTDLNQKNVHDCELGEGIISFNKILDAASLYAVYGVIEQNTKTPIESLKISIAYLNHIQTKHRFK
jgi:sugar phosphate isomerase/epimerase